MTAHWIVREERSGALSLKIALIAFCYISQEHTGTELGKAFLRILDNAEIAVKKVSLLQFQAYMYRLKNIM